MHGLSKDSAATANAPGGRGLRREIGPVRLIEDERIALSKEIPCGESEKGATVSKDALFQTRLRAWPPGGRSGVCAKPAL